MLSTADFQAACQTLVPKLGSIQQIRDNPGERQLINRLVYTCQQSKGCTLDARNDPNGARKLNGKFFERLVRALIREWHQLH